jgi:hypothetical protein
MRRRNRTPANIAGATSAASWSKPVDLKVWLALSSRQFFIIALSVRPMMMWLAA